MKDRLSQFLANTTPQGRTAFRVACIAFLAAASGLPVFIYAAVQTGAWQIYVLLAGTAAIGIATAFSAWLARQNRVGLAMGLLIGSASLIIPLNVALLSGVGVVLGITSFLIIAAISGQTLSGRQATRAWIVGGVTAVITLLIDVLATWNRLSISLLRSAIPLITFGIVVIFSFFLVRQFSNYSLRTKLLSAFLLVALVPLGGVLFFNNYVTTQNLTKSSDAALQGSAAETASALDTFLAERLNDVRTEAQRHILAEYLALPKSERAGSESEAALNTDLLAIARRDQTFITSVGLLDANGLSVADTEPTEVGVDKSNRNYFTGARDLPYASPVEISGTTGAISMYFSAPVRDSSGEFIGVLRIRYDATVIQSIVKNSAEQANLGALNIVVFDENHIRLAHNLAPELIFKSVVPLPADTVTQLQSEGRLYANKPVEELSTNIPSMEAGLNNLDQQPFFVAEFHDEGEGNEEGTAIHLETQPWLVAAGQDQDVFLAPLAAQTRTNVILALIVAGIVAFVALLVAQTISNPVLRLTNVAQQIAGGDIAVQAKVESGDEIGRLAGTFNQMTAQLRELIGSLEQRVADRTKALATSADVSRRLSTILEQKQLVTEVVEQVQKSFNYYHAHIYLLNEAGDELVLAGGTGEAGQTLLALGHKILEGKGLVGRAAETNAPVLVSDTSKSPEWLPNPLLPETKSEVAIPISIGDQILGVLDVQHNIADGLQQEDANLLLSIANQVAVALQNIRQYENTQKIAADMGVVANVGIATSTITDATLLLQEVVDLAKKSFRLYHAHIYLLNEAGDVLELTSGAGEVGRQMVSEKRSIPLDSEQSLVARAARTHEGVVVNDVTTAPDFLPNPLLPDTRAEMAVPMLVAGKVIGVLDVQSENVNRFTDVDVSIKTTLASQVAVALQNARSFSQTQRQVERETALNLITQKIQSATTIEAALQVTARELGHALGMKQTIVSLDPAELHSERKEKQS
jgi:GAF domain-containing protein/HAMP domain-containing protein